MPESAQTLLLASLQNAHAALTTFLSDAPALAAAAKAIDTLSSTINSGHKILICGNGGSLADAVHFAEELTGRFRNDRRPLPALAFADPAHITCTANDYGFDHIFSRLVTAHGRPGDTLIVLSTSGNSPNILLAVEAAKAAQVTTVALLGKSGGALKGLCDTEIIVPGATSDRIQEIHMLLLHIFVQGIEAALVTDANS